MSSYVKSDFVQIPQKFFVRHLPKTSESEMRVYLFMRWKLGLGQDKPGQLTCKEISQALSMGRTQVGQTLRKLQERGLIELDLGHAQKLRIKSAYLPR